MRKSDKMFIQTYVLNSELSIKHRINSGYGKDSYKISQLEQEIMSTRNLIHLS